MIKENLKILEDRIGQKCTECGRDRGEITLVAVSKMFPVDCIFEALETGQIHFGENKAQELDKKSQIVEQEIVWHFIGHLQTNKVKYVVKSADYIHSVDSEKLAAEISKRSANLNKVQKLFLEVKTSDEESKYGITSNDNLVKLAEYCEASSNLELAGLMTMATFTDDSDVIRSSFRKLRESREFLESRGFTARELSMGMSSDFEIAIEEGATMIRVGSSIFGQRNYNKT